MRSEEYCDACEQFESDVYVFNADHCFYFEGRPQEREETFTLCRSCMLNLLRMLSERREDA